MSGYVSIRPYSYEDAKRALSSGERSIDDLHRDFMNHMAERRKKTFERKSSDEMQLVRDEIAAFGKPISDHAKGVIAQQVKERAHNHVPYDLLIRLGVV
jgi:hypothetical protein